MPLTYSHTSTPLRYFTTRRVRPSGKCTLERLLLMGEAWDMVCLTEDRVDVLIVAVTCSQGSGRRNCILSLTYHLNPFRQTQSYET